MHQPARLRQDPLSFLGFCLAEQAFLVHKLKLARGSFRGNYHQMLMVGRRNGGVN
jgi:hypothetical protein